MAASAPPISPPTAFPVESPVDVITPERVGALDENLGDACRRALGLDRSWRKSTLQFDGYLSPRTRETAATQPESSPSR